MHSVWLPLLTPTSSIITTTNPNPLLRTFAAAPSSSSSTRKICDNNSIVCKASSSVSSVSDLDLYDLLGIDSSSDQSQIKLAYRALQKRCHPDIAGPNGHDMAIILNEAYSVLSDPNSRFLYDKEQSKMIDIRGYTGKTTYSVWVGSDSEQRAVFVDEVKCVGCLKCALIADKTFAVESAYGRARVVSQWADPEHKIQEAIEACPVDCISYVERSNLAALEFLMSKQPRGNVRVGAGNAVAGRVSNIFVDVEKFQSRFQDAMDKSNQRYQEPDFQRDARNAAIQTIRAISNWLYWDTPAGGGPTPHTNLKLVHTARKSPQPNINKLREAAAALKNAKENPNPANKIPSNHKYDDEYWTPSQLVLSEPTDGNAADSRSAPKSPPTEESNETKDEYFVMENTPTSPFEWGIPLGTGFIAAVLVKLRMGEGVVAGGVQEHMGGSLVLDVVNSSWLQVILAGVTWYLIGMAVVELVDVFRGSRRM